MYLPSPDDIGLYYRPSPPGRQKGLHYNHLKATTAQQ